MSSICRNLLVSRWTVGWVLLGLNSSWNANLSLEPLGKAKTIAVNQPLNSSSKSNSLHISATRTAGFLKPYPTPKAPMHSCAWRSYTAILKIILIFYQVSFYIKAILYTGFVKLRGPDGCDGNNRKTHRVIQYLISRVSKENWVRQYMNCKETQATNRFGESTNLLWEGTLEV